MDNPAPVVLLPYQQRWLADTSPVRVVEKSRRVGLSWAQAAESALLAGASAGMNSWYVGYNKDMAREFIADVGAWAVSFGIAAGAMEEVLVDDPDGDIQAFRVVFASGFRVTALSSRPNNLRGKQGLVVIDEAAFHDDLAALQKAALALLIWGGRVVIISTHDGVENPFNELVQDCRAGKFPYSVHRITFDDALADGLYQRICVKTGQTWSPEAEAAWRDGIVRQYGETAQEELFCIPRGAGGAYLTRALIEQRSSTETPILRAQFPEGFETRSESERASAVAEWLEANTPLIRSRILPERAVCFGFDFGRTGDLSVLSLTQRLPDARQSLRCMVELRNAPFRMQEALLFALVDLFPRLQSGSLDARGNGQYIAEVALQRWGAARITQVMLTEKWYAEQMPRFKAALEDGDLVDLPRHEDLISDLRLIQVVKGVPRLPEGARRRSTDGGWRHGDGAISLVMAHHAAGRESPPIDFTALDDVWFGSTLTDY